MPGHVLPAGAARAGRAFVLSLAVLTGCSFAADEQRPGTTGQGVTATGAADPAWVAGMSPDALVGGVDADGSPLYVCRGYWNGGTHPGKMQASWGSCDIGYGGGEVYVSTFDTMVPTWVAAAGGKVPVGAVPLGFEASGIAVYACRASYGGGLHPGKLGAGFDGCYVPWGGAEVHVPSYEVLTVTRGSVPFDAVVATRDSFPMRALTVGHESDGTPLYLCLGSVAGGMHPGKMHRDWGACDVPFGGAERWTTTYEVVVPSFQNAPLDRYAMPVYAGRDTDESALYVCAASWNGTTQLGKLVSSGSCHFGYGGAERWVTDGYWVLAGGGAQLTLESWDGFPTVEGGGNFSAKDPTVVDKTNSYASVWEFQLTFDGTIYPASVVYQVSLTPPTTDARSYRDTDQVIDSGPWYVGARGQPWREANYDFTKLLTYEQYATAVVLSAWAGQQPPPRPAYFLPDQDPVDLYVRAIALDSLGNGLLASNTLHVRYGDVQRPVLVIPHATPSAVGAGLQPVHPPDLNFKYHYVCTQQTLFCPYVGYPIQLTPSSSSPLDDLVSAIKSAVDFLSDAWDWIAHAYNSIEKDVISDVCGSDSTCRGIVGPALDAGLAACGLPPTLPDFDQLVQDAQDELIGQLASDLGVDPQRAQDAVHALVRHSAQARSGGYVGATLAPDPNFQYQSAILRVALQDKDTLKPLMPAGTLTITDLSGHFAQTSIVYDAIGKGTTSTVFVPLLPLDPATGFQDTFESCARGADIQSLGQCLLDRKPNHDDWVSRYTTGTAVFAFKATPAGYGGQTVDLGVVVMPLGGGWVNMP